MSADDLKSALNRAEAVLRRRPEMGMHDDATASASWHRGTRVISSHANGTQIATDMPAELGGTGDKVTPGWLFRAGVASCAATSIVMTAAKEGVELTTLHVQVTSRSDTRGLLGMPDSEGVPVYAGPKDLQLSVRIAANGAAPEKLRALVENGVRCSPIPSVVQSATPLPVRIEIDTTTAPESRAA